MPRLKTEKLFQRVFAGWVGSDVGLPLLRMRCDGLDELSIRHRHLISKISRRARVGLDGSIFRGRSINDRNDWWYQQYNADHKPTPDYHHQTLQRQHRLQTCRKIRRLRVRLRRGLTHEHDKNCNGPQNPIGQ